MRERVEQSAGPLDASRARPGEAPAGAARQKERRRLAPPLRSANKALLGLVPLLQGVGMVPSGPAGGRQPRAGCCTVDGRGGELCSQKGRLLPLPWRCCFLLSLLNSSCIGWQWADKVPFMVTHQLQEETCRARRACTPLFVSNKHGSPRPPCRQVPVYIWAPEEEGQFQPGRCSRWWLRHSLAALDSDLRALGSRLLCFRGADSHAVLARLAAALGAGAVLFNHLYDPISMVGAARRAGLGDAAPLWSA